MNGWHFHRDNPGEAHEDGTCTDPTPQLVWADSLTDMGGRPRMVLRSVRVPLKLWEAAKERAAAEEMDISQVVRLLLERYVRRGLR